jgi:hypothetical protein
MQDFDLAFKAFDFLKDKFQLPLMLFGLFLENEISKILYFDFIGSFPTLAAFRLNFSFLNPAYDFLVTGGNARTH